MSFSSVLVPKGPSLRARTPHRLPRRYFESLTRVAPIGIFHTDFRGHAIYHNERWTEISGMSPARSRGHRWADAIHPDDRERVLGQWHAAAAEPRDYQTDYRIVRASGDVRYVHVHAVRVFSASGKWRGHVGTVEDVTERVLAQQQLEASVSEHEFNRRRLQALFEYSSDAIMLADDAGRYVEANPAACELLGMPRDEILATSAADVAAPHIRECFKTQWQAFLSSGEQAGEYVVQRSDGTMRDVEFRAVAHVMPGTHLAILRDVTERKQADRAQQHYVQRLEILSVIDRAILNARSPATIADAVVQQVGELFPAMRSTVLLFDFAAHTVRSISIWSAGETQVGLGAVMSMDEDISGRDVLLGRAVIVNDLAQLKTSSRIDEQLYREGVRSLIRVPLRTKTLIIGALNISSGVVGGLTTDHMAVAQEVADRLAVAITNARLVEEVQANSDGVAAMSKRLVEVQELERRDIARELHEIGQVLTGLKLRIELATRTAPPKVAASLGESATLVHDLVQRVRRLSLNLRPPLLDDFGLKRALAAHFERFTAQTSVQIAFSSSGLTEERMAVEAETAAFRIVQESLTNVARHAGVATAEVDVRVADHRVYVSVADRGGGFDTGTPHPGCSGLTGMHERVALLGGTLRVSSTSGEGTIITAQIPLSAVRRDPA
jgi:PAS domain S-box-containing protein